MPLVVPAELPTADVVIVVPDDVERGGGRVIVFVDPRVPLRLSAEIVMQVREIIHRPRAGDIRVGIAALVQGPAYALSLIHI